MKLVVVFPLACISLFADMSVRDYKANMASDDVDRIALARVYINGVGDGLVTANLEAGTKTGALFCQPPKFALNIDNYVQILDSVIKFVSAKAPPAELAETPIVVLLLEGLEKTFPCKSK